MGKDLLQDYQDFVFTQGSISKRVFHAGQGPPVILMHELGGLADQCVHFANVVRGAGFSVYLPMFFGRPLQSNPFLGFVQLLCIRRQFSLLASNSSGPIADWVRALSREVSDRSGAPVGAIGLCLTGHLVMSMILEDVVQAPVMSEPSFPLCVSGLGISETDVARVRERCRNGLEIVGLRFKRDHISQERRFDRLQDEIGCALRRHEYAPRRREMRPQHSVLTFDYECNKPYPVDADPRELVIGFLRDRLCKVAAEGSV